MLWEVLGAKARWGSLDLEQRGRGSLTERGRVCGVVGGSGWCSEVIWGSREMPSTLYPAADTVRGRRRESGVWHFPFQSFSFLMHQMGGMWPLPPWGQSG